MVGFKRKTTLLGEQDRPENIALYSLSRAYECYEGRAIHGIRSRASLREVPPLLESAGCIHRLFGPVTMQRPMTIKSQGRGGSIGPSILKLSKRPRGQLVRRVCEALEARYRSPRHGNPRKPIDDLIYIILSNKTGPNMAGSVYAALKSRFESWDEVPRHRNSVLERILRPAGLSRIKSAQIRAALKQTRSDFGSCCLRRLAKLPTNDAESYLTSLPGVSDKVAKCVLMYTCGAQVLPIDAHVHRIARRLGWTIRKRADQCHSELESLVPHQRRYAFHVNCVAHGRLICRPSNPDCRACCIKKYCDYNKHVVK